MAKIFDEIAIKITDDGLMKLDGVPMFRKVVHNNAIYIQCMDKDRMRSSCRGTRLVEIRLDLLILAIRQAEITEGVNGTE